MKIVAVSRILNEDDIIEPFIRHHAAMTDHHLLLDNGSVDHTATILARLHAEGLPLTAYRSTAVTFEEPWFNTFLYHAACRTHAADWVVFLDADEFIDLRASGDLRTLLASVPAGIPGVLFQMINYHDRPDDDPNELLVPQRIAHRLAAPTGVVKLCLRGNLPGTVGIDGGNHGASIDGQRALCVENPTVRLAHYPSRSPWHLITKSVIGRLKVLCTGGAIEAAQASAHYTPIFERLLHKPAELLLEQGFLAGHFTPPDLVHDPIRYEGGPLRYTHHSDYRMKAVQSALSFGESLARHHAALRHRAPEPAPPAITLLPL